MESRVHNNENRNFSKSPNRDNVCIKIWTAPGSLFLTLSIPSYGEHTFASHEIPYNG